MKTCPDGIGILTKHLIQNLDHPCVATQKKDAVEDPCWPNGLGNPPFVNVGYENWKQVRAEWNRSNGKRRAPPPPVQYEAVVEGLSTMRRTFQLPGWMRLPDLIDLYVDLWDMDY